MTVTTPRRPVSRDDVEAALWHLTASVTSIDATLELIDQYAGKRVPRTPLAPVVITSAPASEHVTDELEAVAREVATESREMFEYSLGVDENTHDEDLPPGKRRDRDIKCYGCERVLPLEVFWRDASRREGYMRRCIDCTKKQRG